MLLSPFSVVQSQEDREPSRSIFTSDLELTEPVTPIQIQALRNHLKIPAYRSVFLAFDSLNGRQGIDQVLEAVKRLPHGLSQQTCLILMGNAMSTTGYAYAPSMNPTLATLAQDHGVQIIPQNPLTSAEIIAYFHLADVVIAPYQRHLGMSCVLFLAAALSKPVLSDEYGLMGEIVSGYQLGIAVDATSPQGICQGLICFLTHPPQSLCQPALMQSLVAPNTTAQFAEIVFSYLKTHPQPAG